MKTSTRILQYVIIVTALVLTPVTFGADATPQPESPKKIYPCDPDKSKQLRTIISEYKSEYEWIVRDTIEYITALSSMASSDSVEQPPVFTAKAAPDMLTISVTIKGKTYDAAIAAANNPWTPTLYASCCKQLADVFQTSPRTSDSNRIDVLSELMDPSPNCLRLANLKVSRAIRNNPMSAYLHEQAAMLLAVFALKDNSGSYWNPRHALNKMTAHLAISDFLRQGESPSDAGALAKITLSVLVGCQADASSAIDAYQTNAVSTKTKTWLDVLSLRNTGDWTKIKEPVNAPDVLRIEYMRALAAHVSGEDAVEFMRQCRPSPAPDWTRIILANGVSVEIGHEFTESGLDKEFTECLNTCSWGGDRNPQDIKEDESLDFLNRTPLPAWQRRGDKFRVISNEDFAQFAQRQLLLAVQTRYHFLSHMWGVKDYAAKFKAEATKRFGGLRLFCAQRIRWPESQGEYNAAMESIAKVISANPELMSESAWATARRTPEQYQYHNVVPLETDWFVPMIIPGTLYNWANRYCFDEICTNRSAFFQRMLSPAPQDIHIIETYLNKRIKEKGLPPNFDRIFGSTTNYSLRMMNYFSFYRRNDLNIINRMCELDPDNYFKLGARLVELRRKPEAAEAYQKGVDHGRNRVRVANNVDWLVNYYYDNGQTSKALEVAEMAAAVYSYCGLETMMKLQERMGDLESAEAYGKRIKDRYQNGKALLFFYRCHKDIDEYARKFDEEIRETFPNGLKAVSLKDFSGKPVNGVMIENNSQSLQKFGLKPGCIIKALDGYQSDTVKQYMLIRDFTNTTRMALIVWQDGEYKELTVFLPNRRFGVDIDDYVPGKFNL